MNVKRNLKQDIIELEKPLINYIKRTSWEDVEDELLWEDIYLLPDVVEGDPIVIYLYDSRTGRLYWGYIDQKVFEREPDPEVEEEIIEEYFGE